MDHVDPRIGDEVLLLDLGWSGRIAAISIGPWLMYGIAPDGFSQPYSVQNLQWRGASSRGASWRLCADPVEPKER